MKKWVSLFIFSITFGSFLAQHRVAITIDDIPNHGFFLPTPNESKLLKTLDSLEIPICIFINEGRIFHADSILKKKLLHQWAERKYVTLGNHSFSHFHYSEVDLKTFSEDIVKGEWSTKQLAKKYKKSLSYFRFPFNDLGKDSNEHNAIALFLQEHNYKIAPFTVESSDWMYNYVYEFYLSKNDTVKAKQIGLDYVGKTMELFAFYENFSREKYGRNISHIYMCHDNLINAHYLIRIVDHLENENYKMITLKKALKDKVYDQKDFYHKKWGISWMYRWIPTSDERKIYFNKEPSLENIEKLFNQLKAENSGQ